MKLEVPIKVDIDDVTKLIHDLQCLQTYKLGVNDTTVLVSLDAVADVFADHIRAKRLDKDINVPSKSALDHIHNVVRDDAYKRGYDDGKKDAIPMDWIHSYIEMCDMIQLRVNVPASKIISVMVNTWKQENPGAKRGEPDGNN